MEANRVQSPTLPTDPLAQLLLGLSPGGSAAIPAVPGAALPFERILADTTAAGANPGNSRLVTLLPGVAGDELDPAAAGVDPAALESAPADEAAAAQAPWPLPHALATEPAFPSRTQPSRLLPTPSSGSGDGKPLPPATAATGNPLPPAEASDADQAPALTAGFDKPRALPDRVLPGPPAVMAAEPGTVAASPAGALPDELRTAVDQPAAAPGLFPKPSGQIALPAPGDAAGAPTRATGESALTVPVQAGEARMDGPGRTAALSATWQEMAQGNTRPATAPGTEPRGDGRSADSPPATSATAIARGAGEPEPLRAAAALVATDGARLQASSQPPGQPRDGNPTASSPLGATSADGRAASEATVRERAFFDRMLDTANDRAGPERQPIVIAAERRTAGEWFQRRLATGREGAESADSRGLQVSEHRDPAGQALTARPVTAAAGRDLAALAERVETLMHRGGGAARISLNLGDLGEVEVSVRMESRDAHVRFVVQDPAVREALDAQLPRLRQLLEDSGLRLGDVSTGLPGGSPDDSGRREGFDRRMADGHGARPPSEALSVEPEDPHTPPPGELDHTHLLDAIV